MAKWLRAAWNFIRHPPAGTPYDVMAHGSEEDRRDLYKDTFEQAKHHSDIVAMFTRLGFELVAAFYFFGKVEDANWFFRGVFTLCAFWSFIAAANLGWRLGNVLLLIQWMDLHKKNRRPAKISYSILGMIIYA